MTKYEFLSRLSDGLRALPSSDANEHLRFYSEMIDDRMEEGLSEEEAVAAVGCADEIIAQITADLPAPKAKKRLEAWKIVLLAVGMPLWLALGIAAVAVVASVYISVWAVLISLWAVFGSLVGCALGGLASSVGLFFGGQVPSGIAMIAVGLVSAGLAIFAFFCCKAATAGVVALTKKSVVLLKQFFCK